MRGKTRIIAASLLGLLLALGPFMGLAEAAKIVTFDDVKKDDILRGSAESFALKITFAGEELIVAGGESSGSFTRSLVQRTEFNIPAKFATSCDNANAVKVEGTNSELTNKCVDRQALQDAGFSNADASVLSVDALVAAGIGSLDAVGGQTISVRDKAGTSESVGLVIPGLFESKANCGPGTSTDSADAFTTSPALDPVIIATIASADCNVDLGSLPVVEHLAGEAGVALTLTSTLVDALDVNALLDGIQASAPLPDEVNNAIDAIQADLESSPLAEIIVAANRGAVEGTADGLRSLSPGATVRIFILGGIIEIGIGLSQVSATVANGTPTATADVATLSLRVLDITTLDPDDTIIDQEFKLDNGGDIIEVFGDPSDPLHPLHILVSAGVAQTAQSCDDAEALIGSLPSPGSFQACAAATGESLTISLLEDPLPNLTIELVNTRVLAVGSFGQGPRPVIPITGATATTTLTGGILLAGAGFLARRRLLGP